MPDLSGSVRRFGLGIVVVFRNPSRGCKMSFGDLFTLSRVWGGRLGFRRIDGWEKPCVGRLLGLFFGLTVDGRVSIVDLFDDLGNTWLPHLRKNLNDWEIVDMCRLLSLLDGLIPDLNVRDGWEWTISSKGRFSSKSLYLELLVLDKFILFPHKSIVILGIPSNVAFFYMECFSR